MGYYLRFLVTDSQEISLVQVEAGLKQSNLDYRISDGDLMLGEDVLAEIEINCPSDGLFDEEIEELTEEVQEKRSRNKKRVAEVLQQAKAIVAVRVLSQGRDEEETMEKLVPLWEWLFVNRTGLLQADADGYYDQTRRILKVD